MIVCIDNRDYDDNEEEDADADDDFCDEEQPVYFSLLVPICHSCSLSPEK